MLRHQIFHHRRALGGRRRQFAFIDHSFRDSGEFFAPDRLHKSRSGMLGARRANGADPTAVAALRA
jgi:hypothetical protein